MLTIIGFSASRAGSGMALTPALPGSRKEKVVRLAASVVSIQPSGLVNRISESGAGLAGAGGSTAAVGGGAGFSLGTL